MNDATDEDLLRRLARRDPAAFHALWERHAPRLWLMALRLTRGDAAPAEELVQETWVRAAAGAGRYAGGASVRTWLIAILINVRREEARRAARLTAETHADRPAGGEPALDLERAVRALPDGCREVFLLHDLEGYTHDEVGALLGIDAGSSRSQLSRARARIRRVLSGGTADERT